MLAVYRIRGRGLVFVLFFCVRLTVKPSLSTGLNSRLNLTNFASDPPFLDNSCVWQEPKVFVVVQLKTIEFLFVPQG